MKTVKGCPGCTIVSIHESTTYRVVMKTENCRICGNPAQWIDCPTGGWWSHIGWLPPSMIWAINMTDKPISVFRLPEIKPDIFISSSTLASMQHAASIVYMQRCMSRLVSIANIEELCSNWHVSPTIDRTGNDHNGCEGSSDVDRYRNYSGWTSVGCQRE
jgi:hypothetical protein